MLISNNLISKINESQQFVPNIGSLKPIDDSFIMCLNNKHEIDKLQVLQNRALRMYFNIQNPRDINIQHLHELANVDILYKRRMPQLLSIIYDL